MKTKAKPKPKFQRKENTIGAIIQSPLPASERPDERLMKSLHLVIENKRSSYMQQSNHKHKGSIVSKGGTGFIVPHAQLSDAIDESEFPESQLSSQDEG
jgi:hypothetical protein